MNMELNNIVKTDRVSGLINKTSPIVEVFSCMAQGKEITKMPKDVANKAVEDIKKLAKIATEGNQFDSLKAKSEINEIRKEIIQPKLLQELKILGAFGSYKPLGWNDKVEFETIEIKGVESKIQAEGVDVSTPFYKKKKRSLTPVTVSGGFAANYRELMYGNFEGEFDSMNQVRTQIRNTAARYVMATVVQEISSYNGVKYFLSSAGLAKSGVDDILTKVRRYGRPTVSGDYALISQFTPWAGYANTLNGINIGNISERAMNEIMDNGFIGSYNGAALQVIENAYDFTRKTSDGTNYETMYPAGVGIITPVAPPSGVAPVQCYSIGDLTSLEGVDVTSGEIMTRFDLSVAAGVATPEAIGIIIDENLGSF